jgi:carbonic anhydrase/acetyltransferase-like protein (isoleucine patch superfamily)
MPVYALDQITPQLHASAFLAPDAQLIGNVTLRAHASVWFGSVLRGDSDQIDVGEESNLQDHTVCHVDPGCPLTIGARVTVGHRCILHGCLIADDCLIGMGSILMNQVQIGSGSIVGAGSLLTEGTVVPPFSLVLGSPAKVRKTYGAEILRSIRKSAEGYVVRGRRYQTELRRV